MRRVIDYFRGNVRVEAVCKYGERFINICARNAVDFWDMKRVGEGTVQITIHLKDYKRLKELAENGGFELRSVKTEGVPFFWFKIKKRYALIGGMALCILAVWFMSFFIWEIDVHGNETVPTSEILAKLDEMGVGIGTCRLTINHNYISNEMLLELTDLCWITVNTHGSRAEVLVREETAAPEVVDEDTPTLVYAVKAGIITRMVVWNGATVEKIGGAVLPGETIVTGVMDSIGSGTRFVHAMAQVYARTRYELYEQIPLNYAVKEYTGEEKRKTALIIAGRRINLYHNGGISWASYDKIIDEKLFVVAQDSQLPFSIVNEIYREYVPEERRLTEDEAEQLLTERLLERLEKKIGDGEILETDFSVSVKNGVMTVTMTAECEEQIAAARRLTWDEMTITEETADEDPSEGET